MWRHQGTVPSQQSSHPYGVEWANYCKPIKRLALDFDLADFRALFTARDGDDAVPGSSGGKRVPEAAGFVIASGVTLPDLKGFSPSLRLRYFGPHDLTSDGAAWLAKLESGVVSELLDPPQPLIRTRPGARLFAITSV